MGRNRRREKKKQIESKPKTQQLPYIPEPIVLEIISRLPINSLLRFTSVSKSWRSSILDPKFSFSTATTPRVLIMSGWSSYWSDKEQVSLHTITTDTKLAWPKKLPHPWSEVEFRKGGFKVMGSCKGLLLVGIHQDLFLWNPSTRCCKLVLFAFNRFPSREGYRGSSGLCYDSSTREYKAVLALASHSTDHEFVVVGNFTNRSWTEVNSPYSARRMESGPVVNELLHWLVFNRAIVYFVPETNEFVDLPIPLDFSKYDDKNKIIGLGVLEGCLCMVHFNHGNVEVLAMKEHGVKESWTRLFVLSNFGLIDHRERLVPLCWTKGGGEVLMVLCKRRVDKVLAYNPSKNSCRNIRIPGKQSYLMAYMWEESLVSVPADYGWEADEVQGKADYVDILPSS